MKIHGFTVTKNEASRYLTQFLDWSGRFLDDHFIYDDESTDDTVARAFRRGAIVKQRSYHVPTFMQNEGEFRQAAWEAFEEYVQPKVGDWVLALDADEFLVAEYDEREALEDISLLAEVRQETAVMLPIPEVFGYDEEREKPLIRVDGYWAHTQAPRFFRYQPGGQIPQKKMGGGSVPTYVHAFALEEPIVHLLHFGYAREEDRFQKYERYTSKKANGHNPRHIASILEDPKLELWAGKEPW